MTLLTACRVRVSSDAPCHSAGYSIAPTPMIAPWPFIRRGTEWLVPMVPGLVSVMVVPWKSSTASLPSRAFLTSVSYAVQKAAKSMVSAALMDGTRSWRLPSGLARSIAIPRLTWAGVIRVGLPSTTSKPTFISGIDRSARTIAKPTMWVKDTLPPRARARWLLMTIRLSQSSFTGTLRTEVAVGTSSEASMFCTVRAGAPRRTVNVGSSLASAGRCGVGSLATGLVVPAGGLGGRHAGRGRATGAGGAETAGAGAAGAGAAGAGAAAGRGAGPGRRRRRAVGPAPLPAPPANQEAHSLDTLDGSDW